MGVEEINAELQRSVGVLQGQVGELQRQNAQMMRILTQMRDTIEQARGGWRMLVIVGSAAAAVGAFIATVISGLRS